MAAILDFPFQNIIIQISFIKLKMNALVSFNVKMYFVSSGHIWLLHSWMFP